MKTRSLTIHKIEDLEIATGKSREFRPVQLGSVDVRGKLNIAEIGGLRLTHGKFYSDMHVSGTYSNEKLSLGVLLKADNIRCFGKEAQKGDLVNHPLIEDSYENFLDLHS